MRIGLVLDESLDPEDGVQQYVMRVGAWMSSQGHDVHYLVGETHHRNLPNLRSLSKNMKVSFNGNRLSVPLPVSRKKLSALLNELDLDVLHVQCLYSPFLAGKLLSLAGPTLGVVGTFHVLPYGVTARIGSRLLGALTHRTSRRFDEMMAVSGPASGFARSHFGLDCQGVPNPFDFKRFYRTLSSTEEDSKKIVFLGRLVERKGPMELIRAVAWLDQQGKWPAGWKVALGGKGPLLDQLTVLRDSTDLKEIVELVGFIPDEDKVRFLSEADIAVFPSISGESFGISLLEGMAAARGVVLGGDNPGYASVMPGREYLLDPTDMSAFSGALLRYMNDATFRKTASEVQKKHVKQFDIELVGPKIEQVYLKAVERRRALVP